MNKEDIEFLKDLQHEMLTQDTVSQADPRFWVVQGTIKEYGYDSDYADGCVIVIDCETTIDSMIMAYNYIGEYDNEHTFSWDEDCEMINVFDLNGEEIANLDTLENVCEFMEKYNVGNCNDGGYPYICYYKNVDKIYEDTMFLTNRECKEHIKSNYYHYPHDAHSYAMTAWRSPQVERLYKILQNTDWNKIKTDK